MGDGGLGRRDAAPLCGTRDRRPDPGRCAPVEQDDRPAESARRNPPARGHAGQRAGAPPSGIRRVAAGPTAARAAQTSHGTRGAGHRPPDVRQTRRPVLRGVAVRPHRSPVTYDRGDRGRPRRAAPDASAAAGRRRCRQDRRGDRRDACRRGRRSPGGPDGADRSARGAARHERASDARGCHRAGPREPVRRSATAHRAVDEQGHGVRTARRCSPASPTGRSTSRSAPMR